MGANGNNFVLGVLNNAATKVTGLVGNVDGAAALRVTNPNSGTNDTALDLRVQAGEAPMKVNSPTKVANLNADKLDGKDPNAFLSSSTYDSWTTLEGTANAWTFGWVACEPGDLVVSGGCQNTDRGTTVERSLPYRSSGSSGWTIGYFNGATADNVSVKVTCADM